MTSHPPILAALAAALLFGASTPFAKQLAGDISPILLAGLLYLGSGIGLWVVRLIRDRGFAAPDLPAREWPWLLGAIASGGVLGPLLLMVGLTHTSAADASLLLNLEAVLTAVLAWVVFRENADRRIVLGMLLIVAGGLLLAWSQHGGTVQSSALGSFAVAGACLCWAVDNNLTRKVSATDAVFIAGTKGLVAGITNCTLALALGVTLPAWPRMAEAMSVGLAGYGVSLVLFVLALRGLGSARTGAYFSTAPFIGAVVAIAVFQEPTSAAFWLAAVLMGVGVWLHLTERHEHLHTHEPLEHVHRHVHDEHHRHEHAFAWDGVEPHSHPHRHAPITHRHPHFPDVHHQHSH
ncbi:Permease of the drug/metabolite transporter (DMT) superfamily [Dyella jiangningensis]|jgi:drug/metabolite transporter (DMT)-like permease|uniref:DMT family transporter n=1 Tax=Dyella sp. AtDHG13 TaxID=1938897 RepID=UPI0008878284|nr:DMT family transporter [Dyella sp. AtDHG13]MBL6750972.1 EamA family transporter [Nevskia sp.]PXV60439.1 drug/metabolite transporter (DMT)-like permease [Dyella sp. AtDHG13]SDJ45529.1 Permease of the drug/metabolite transporter (DMT) superfamily [Dyella jiangningensis]